MARGQGVDDAQQQAVGDEAARSEHEQQHRLVGRAEDVDAEHRAVADQRAEEIIAKANKDAASIRGNAESEIADLTEKLSSLRKQTSDYYASMKKIVDAQNASMDQLKKLL